MFNPIKKSIPYGSHTLTLETGEIARQANGAVMVSLGDTVVLVTAVAAKKPAMSRSLVDMACLARSINDFGSPSLEAMARPAERPGAPVRRM